MDDKHFWKKTPLKSDQQMTNTGLNKYRSDTNTFNKLQLPPPPKKTKQKKKNPTNNPPPPKKNPSLIVELVELSWPFLHVRTSIYF